MSLLLPALQAKANGGNPNLSQEQIGKLAGKCGGDIEIIFGGNKFNPTSNDSTHQGHILHWRRRFFHQL